MHAIRLTSEDSADSALADGVALVTLQPTLSGLSQALLGSNSSATTSQLLSSADYASLLPIADTITALTVTLPAYNASIFMGQLGRQPARCHR